MEPRDPYTPLLTTLGEGSGPTGTTTAGTHTHSRPPDCVLGLFPASARQPADPVWTDSVGVVTRIAPKSHSGLSPLSWGVAVWNPTITDFMRAWVRENATPSERGEASIGHVLNEARRHGLRVVSRKVSPTPFLDIGTPEGLSWARRGLVSPPPDPDGGVSKPPNESD